MSSYRISQTIKTFKRPKSYMTPGRHYKRLEDLIAKKQKLETMEALIAEHEKQLRVDTEYVRGLKKRANEVRSQLRVLSTVEKI